MRAILQRPRYAVLWVVLLFAGQVLLGAVRIKDIATLRGGAKTQLVGYSLVVGLNGSGDSRRSLFTQQSVRNMLRNFGLSLEDQRLYTRNVAAVMVTAELSPFVRSGATQDVVVSSMGDATSLEGGTLLRSPLLGPDGQVYGQAQGALSVGGINIETVGGERFRRNHALVGRVPSGAVIERDQATTLGAGGRLELLLRQPDFTTALRVANAVDSTFGASIANPLDAATVAIQIPAEYQNQVVRMMAQLEAIEIVPDQIARVVINERTGTVVVGGNVKLSPAAVSQGNLTVRVAATPMVSQPLPFSQGQTVVTTQTATTVDEEQANQMMVLNEPANVNDLAAALNSLRVKPRDIISIFQALKQAGALQAELVIM